MEFLGIFLLTMLVATVIDEFRECESKNNKEDEDE